MMNVMKNALALSFLLTSQISFANILQVVPSDKILEGKNIPKSAITTLPGQPVELRLVGAGVRVKKILFKFNVYVAELFVSNHASFVRKSEGRAALDSLNQSEYLAMRLEMLRGISKKDLRKAFLEAFEANQVDVNTPPIQKFLTLVMSGSDPEKGQTTTIFVDRKKNTLYYEDGKGTTQSLEGSADFFQKVFSIWLGEPKEDEMKNLKQALIQF